MRQQIHRALEADALDEVPQCFAHQAAKNPVEVVRRETGGAGDVFEPYGLGKVLGDVVDRAVDAVDVVEFLKLWSH